MKYIDRLTTIKCVICVQYYLWYVSFMLHSRDLFILLKLIGNSLAIQVSQLLQAK